MFRVESKYTTGHPKDKFWHFCKKISYKIFHKKAYYAQFCEFAYIFSPRLYLWVAKLDVFKMNS